MLHQAECLKKWFVISIAVLITLENFIFNLNLKDQYQKNDLSRVLGGKSLYIAALLKDNENIIKNWIHELLKSIDVLGPVCNQIFVSILENGDSNDQTAHNLLILRRELQSRGIANEIRLKKLVKPDQDRISFLAQLRNKALSSLNFLGWVPRDTRIIFLNDIWYRHEDLMRLLLTERGDYDMACALDYYYRFYDDWVTRDFHGLHLKPHHPHFTHKLDLHRQWRGQSIKVYSCWNGMVVLRGEPFMVPMHGPLQFRDSSPTEPYHSECFLICKDLQKRGYQRIIINPQVKIAYMSWWYFFHNYIAPTLINPISRVWSKLDEWKHRYQRAPTFFDLKS